MMTQDAKRRRRLPASPIPFVLQTITALVGGLLLVGAAGDVRAAEPAQPVSANAPATGYSIGLYRDGQLVKTFQDLSLADLTGDSQIPLPGPQGDLRPARVKAAAPALSIATSERNAMASQAGDAGLRIQKYVDAVIRIQGPARLSGDPELSRLAVDFLEGQKRVGEGLAALQADLEKRGLPPTIVERHAATVRQHEERLATIQKTLAETAAGVDGAGARLHGLLNQAVFVRQPSLPTEPVVHTHRIEAPRQTREEADAAADIAAAQKRATPARSLRTLQSAPTRSPKTLRTAAASLSGGDAPVAGDLAATPEVQLTTPVLELAQSLGNSPLAIYEYVRNNVEFQPYVGSRKGSDFTLKQRGGNDTDQASLLIALLRAAGIPARYARGTVEMTPEQAMALTGVDEPHAAASILTTAGLDGLAIVDGPDVVAVRSTRVWVLAYVPYSNYRGAGADDSGKAWIPLDPSFKAFSVTAGQDVLTAMGWNVDTFLASYISTFHPLSPIEQLQSDIQSWLDANQPGTTVADIERRLSIGAQGLGLLPASLPYQVLSVGTDFNVLEDAMRYKVRFHLHDNGLTFIDHTVRVSDLAGHRLTIEYVGATPADQAVIDSYGSLYETPPGGVEVKPVLKLDNTPIATGSGGIGMGYTHNSDMHFTVPSGAHNTQPSVENEIIAGNGQAIAFDTFLDTAPLPFEDTLPSPDLLIEAVMQPTAVGYLSRVSGGMRTANKLLRGVAISDVSEAIVENSIKVTYSGFGVPLSFEWTGLVVDADRRVIGPFGVEGGSAHNLPYMKLTGYDGSVMENRIFEDTFAQEAISTIKILELSNDAGIGVCTITTSIAAQCPGFSQSASVTAAVNNALSQGHHVTIPKRPITVQDWSGTGYIDLNPTTGAGGYIISGGISGNVTVSGGATVARWDITFTCPFTSFDGTVTKPAADSPDPSAIFCGTDTTPLDLEGTVTVTCRNGTTQTKSLKPPFALPSPKDIVTNPALGPGDYQVTLFALGTTKILRKLTIVDLEIEIYKPKVLDPSETLVPKGSRAAPGAQTFVNLDNDDADAKFDDTDDAVAGGDDELIKVKLKLRPKTLPSGTIKLLAASGAADIKAWKQNDKSTANAYALATALNIPADVTVEGDALVKELWVEGIRPHTAQKGTMLDAEFAIATVTCKPLEQAAITILGIDKIEWVGKSNSRTDGNALDADPNWPGGLVPAAFRVFPDARSSGGSLVDKVDVRAKLSVAPIEKIDAYFRSFDVDDATDAATPVDDDTAAGVAEDNRGTSPAKAGKLKDADANGIAKVEFTGAEATFEFQTTAQPGDNFRVVGNGDKDFLGTLENDERAGVASQADKERIVDRNVAGTAAQKEVLNPDKYASPVLVVWRFLHVEKDSMAAVPAAANILTTRITDFTGTSAAATRLKMADALNDGSPDLDDAPARNGRFEKGTARIAAGAFVVTPLTGNDNDEVVHPATAIVPLAFHAEDNDILFNSTLDGTITTITKSGGAFVLTLNITSHSETPIDWPDFVGGTVQMASGPGVPITAVNAAGSTVTVSTLGIPVELTDDDSRTTLPQVGDLSHLVTVLREAYIETLDDGGGNAANNQLNCAFMLNLAGTTAAADNASFQRQATGTDGFWVGYLLQSYQYSADSDTDPDLESGTGGVAYAAVSNTAVSGGGQGTHLFTETTRDRLANTGATAGLVQRVTAHEIGHQMGLDHWDTGEAGVPGGAVASNLMLRSMQSTPNASALLIPMHKHLLRSRVKSPGT